MLIICNIHFNGVYNHIKPIIGVKSGKKEEDKGINGGTRVCKVESLFFNFAPLISPKSPEWPYQYSLIISAQLLFNGTKQEPPKCEEPSNSDEPMLKESLCWCIKHILSILTAEVEFEAPSYATSRQGKTNQSSYTGSSLLMSPHKWAKCSSTWNV